MQEKEDFPLFIELMLPDNIPVQINISDSAPKATNAKQEQIQDLLFSREIGWQDIIYDLINTEQLEPWDIDIVLLTDRFMERIQKLEEGDFFISSKVLLAAALLLRIKSEVLLNKDIPSIDQILFGGKKEDKKYIMERITLDEDVPDLMPRSPIPRFKRVTLQELMEALDKAIVTENRRIKKVLINANALRESSFSLPKKNYSIKDKIEEIYNKLFNHFETNKEHIKVPYSHFVGNEREERILSFAPLLHLENQKKIWLEQEEHFGEIHIWMKKKYFEHNPDPFADLKQLSEKEELEDWEKAIETAGKIEDIDKPSLTPEEEKKYKDYTQSKKDEKYLDLTDEGES